MAKMKLCKIGFFAGILMTFIPLAIGRITYGELPFSGVGVVNPVIFIVSGLGLIIWIVCIVVLGGRILGEKEDSFEPDK